jgi:signal transduction histidine kinase
LVEEFRQAGMDVTASIAEEPAGIDPEVSAAAYRVVQEALVNARKHGTGIVRLAVTVARGNVHIEAVNRRSLDTSDEQTAGGYGLIGMRERAASAGGRIDIDSDDALFTLRAVLPVRGRTS